MLLVPQQKGGDLSIKLLGAFYKDEVSRMVEDAQSGAGDIAGKGDGVAEGHVAVLGAV